jgi:Peptidase C13 family
MRLFAALLLLSSQVAVAAESVRLVVSLGSNYGRPDDVVLQHAEDDARRVKDVFVELGGVEPGRAVVLTRPTAAQVREKFAEVTGRVVELKASGRSVQLMVFATSHGRNGVLHLTGSDLPVAELRELASKTGAELRVVIVDACESGLREERACVRARPREAGGQRRRLRLVERRARGGAGVGLPGGLALHASPPLRAAR